MRYNRVRGRLRCTRIPTGVFQNATVHQNVEGLGIRDKGRTVFFDRAENVACLENCDWGGTLSFSRVRRTFHE